MLLSLGPSKDQISLKKMVDDYPSEFLKDLARDLEVREWQRLGHDYQVILHDCPVGMNEKATGPFFCEG